MDELNLTTMMPLFVALVGSAGLWKFLSVKSQQAHDRAVQDQESRAQFNDTLKEQVDHLTERVETLASEKEKLLLEMGKLREDLATATATIKHLEQTLLIQQSK